MVGYNCYASFQDIIEAYKRSSKWENLSEESKLAYRKPLERLQELGNQVNSNFTTGFAMQLPVAVARSRSGFLDEDEWNRAIRSLSVSNAEKNKMFMLLNMVYRGAKLPVMEFKALPHEVEETVPYSKAEIETLWLTPMSLRLRIAVAFLRVCYHTGMRPWNEVLPMAKAQVDEDVVSVMGSKKREKGKVTRMVPMLPPLKECLEFMAQMVSPFPACQHLVWVTEQGKPLTRSAVLLRLEEACILAQVPKRQVYDARRGVATDMLRKGYSKQDVADLLGHKDLRTVDKYDQRSKKEKAMNFKGV